MEQCLENMVESLNGLETDSQSKMTKITDIFDALIQQMNQRKKAMIDELKNDTLKEKESALSTRMPKEPRAGILHAKPTPIPRPVRM